MFSPARFLPTLLGTLLAAGCAPSGMSPAPTASAAAPAPTIASLEAAPSDAAAKVELPAGLRNGEDFAQARESIIAAGWLPLQSYDECSDTLGEAFGDSCLDLPEIQGCEVASARCQVRYGKAGESQSLDLVVASGPSKKAAQLHLDKLVSFETTPIDGLHAGPQPGDACPSPDFREFLKVFAAATPAERLRLSEPLLRKTIYVDIAADFDKGQDFPRNVLVPSSRADRFGLKFMLGFADGKFQREDSTGERLGPVEPDLDADGDDLMYVTFPDDVEGTNYIFRRQSGCWRWEGSR